MLLSAAIAFSAPQTPAASGDSVRTWLTRSAELSQLPWTAWTSTNRLAIFNGTSIDLIDPATGRRTPFVLAATFAKAATAAKMGNVPLAAPEAWSPTMSMLAFRVGRDLVAYDVAGRRMTKIDGGDVRGLAFAPDGTRLAYAKDRDLYVWTAAVGKSLRLTHADRARLLNGVLTWVYWEEILSREEIAFHWSPDSKRLAYLQADESPVKESSFVDFDRTPPTVHLQTYPFAGGANPKVRVGVVPASGGATVWLRPGPSEYVSRFGWTPSAAPWLLTLDRRQKRSELWEADFRTGAARRVAADTNPQWINWTEDIKFLPGGTVLMNSQRDGFDRLYRWNAEGAIVNAVTPPKQSLAKRLFATHGVHWVDPKGREILFTSGDPQRFERQLYRVRTDGGSLAMVTAEPGDHNVSVSPNGDSYVDVHSRLDDPPQMTLMRMDGRSIAKLRARPALPPDYRKAQMLRIPARDGFRLPAYVRLPAGYDESKQYPAIIYVYGGPALPTVNDAWAGAADQVFAAAGYVVFVVDPRSATRLDERLSRSAKGTAVGTRELNDLVDAVRWLKKQSYVDPTRVGLWGWSGGGSLTLLGLTRSNEFAAGVAVAPVTDWRFYDTVYTEGIMGLPTENPQGYFQTARWRDAKNLSGRLLLMYGTHDDNVHPINEEKFLDALIAADKTAEVMVFPNRKHGMEDPSAFLSVIRTMLDFFKRSLR